MIVAFLVVLPTILTAAEIEVTTAVDAVPPPAGGCTLRAAIEAMNAGAATGDCPNSSTDPFGVNNSIRLAAELAGETIALSGDQLPVITQALKITGPVDADPAGVVIDGGGASRIFDILGNAANEFAIELDALTLTGGRTTGADERGGAVRVENADITLNHVDVVGNRTEGIIEDDVVGNSGGGGLSVQFGNVTIRHSNIADNRTEGPVFSFGGGINMFRGDIEITGSTISGNSTAGAAAFGGGMFIEEAHLSLVGSMVEGNWTTGADAFGGGLFFGGKNGHMAELVNSTVSNNWTEGDSAHGGGVGAGLAEVVLLNSTVSGNFTLGKNAGGGGLAAGLGHLTLTHSTIAFNAAAGGADGVFLEEAEDTLTLENSLVVQADESETACSQMAQSEAASLATDNSCTGVATDLEDIDLAALADNGGATQTHALNAGSVAIDAADADYCTGHDQRGVSRPQGEGCDIGAYEVERNQPDTLFRDRFESLD